MTRLTISVPDQMGDWIDGQIASGRYGSVSDYVRDLVRRDQDRQARPIELRDVLDDSGNTTLTPEERAAGLAELHRLLDRRLAQADAGEVVPFDLDRIRELARRKRP